MEEKKEQQNKCSSCRGQFPGNYLGYAIVVVKGAIDVNGLRDCVVLANHCSFHDTSGCIVIGCFNHTKDCGNLIVGAGNYVSGRSNLVYSTEPLASICSNHFDHPNFACDKAEFEERWSWLLKQIYEQRFVPNSRYCKEHGLIQYEDIGKFKLESLEYSPFFSDTTKAKYQQEIDAREEKWRKEEQQKQEENKIQEEKRAKKRQQQQEYRARKKAKSLHVTDT